MRTRIFWFLSLMFAALAMAPALAHLFELINKMQLSRDDYWTVQKIYRGWALVGVFIFGSLIATFILTILSWRRSEPFLWPLVALVCIAITQAIFWTFTFPTNQVTQNWTIVPAGDWEALRYQWEYSHAASAAFNVIAFVALSYGVTRREAHRPVEAPPALNR